MNRSETGSNDKGLRMKTMNKDCKDSEDSNS